MRRIFKTLVLVATLFSHVGLQAEVQWKEILNQPVGKSELGGFLVQVFQEIPSREREERGAAVFNEYKLQVTVRCANGDKVTFGPYKVSEVGPYNFKGQIFSISAAFPSKTAMGVAQPEWKEVKISLEQECR